MLATVFTMTRYSTLKKIKACDLLDRFVVLPYEQQQYGK